MKNHIVLVHPQIPPNTGNIMRTCVATDTILHLIEPIGFSLTDKDFRRAGMDYVADLTWYKYENWESFTESNSGNFHFFTRYSKRIYSEDDYTLPGDHYLVFGHEHDGIPKEILKAHLDQCVRIPMFGDTRSLNLSNAAAIGIYEAQRQQGFLGLSTVEVQKGKDFIY